MNFTAYMCGTVKSYQVLKHHSALPEDSHFTLTGHRPWTDVEIMVNGTPRKAHKFVLASRSPVMAKLLLSDNDPIRIEASETNINTLFGFMYHGLLQGPVNEELLDLARNYEIRTLIEICEAAKEVDSEMDILRLDSINEELRNYSDKRRKLMENYKGDYEVSIELTQRIGYIQPFPDHLLRWNPHSDQGPERHDPNLHGIENSQIENCDYDTVIRHCSEIKFEKGQASMRWSFSDRFKNLSFFAAIHENEDPDSFVDISLRFVQRKRIACSIQVVKVLFLIHTEPYQRVIRPKTQIGELVQRDGPSQIRVWRGKAYGWTNQCDLPHWLPRIEFFIFGKGPEGVETSVRDGLLLNDFLSSFKEGKWTDVNLQFGGAKIESGDVQHRTDSTKLAAHRYMIGECSPFFARMLPEEIGREMKTLVLSKEELDVDQETLKAILNFFYSGKLAVSAVDQKLLKAAEKLENTALIKLCKKTLNDPSDCEALLHDLRW